jgi:purine-nucleoside phosphorylase
MTFHDREAVTKAAGVALERLGGPVTAAVILGSGFSPLLGRLEGARRIPYGEIPGFPGCGAPGHAGELAAGAIGGRRLAIFSGRFHLYEGFTAAEAALPVALAHALGARGIVLTCAAGATTDAHPVGSMILVEDHINLMGENPLASVPVAERRPPFLPMADAYDARALALAEEILGGRWGDVRRGVLAALPGPSYETPAEYRVLARLGADVVSMSCVPETIVARALGLRVLALAMVANGPARLGGAGAGAHEVLSVVEARIAERLDRMATLLSEFTAFVSDSY